MDVTPPVISDCPSFIFQQVSLGTGDASVTWIEPSATDNSGIVILAERSHRPGSTFQPGVVDVVYVFADPAGNEATCTFRVTVEEGMCLKSVQQWGQLGICFALLPEKCSFPRKS